jgi:hypothetical protein
MFYDGIHFGTHTAKKKTRGRRADFESKQTKTENKEALLLA